MDILEAMAARRGVTIIPENAELTTVQAAAVLNVSRPFLIKLLKTAGFRIGRSGKHRRVRMEDVMAYKTAIDRTVKPSSTSSPLKQQEQGMGYGE